MDLRRVLALRMVHRVVSGCFGRFEAQFCPRWVRVDLPEGHIPGIYPKPITLGIIPKRTKRPKLTKSDKTDGNLGFYGVLGEKEALFRAYFPLIGWGRAEGQE